MCCKISNGLGTKHAWRGRIAALALLAIAASGCRAKREPVPPLAPVSGWQALPAAAHTVVGIDVSQVLGSSFLSRVVSAVFAAAPELEAPIAELFSRCQIQLGKDIRSVWLAFGDAPEELVAVASGDLSEERWVSCVRALDAPGRGQMRSVIWRGRRVYRARFPAVPTPERPPAEVWFTFGDPHTLILAPSERWLRRTRDPGARKLASDPAWQTILARLQDTGALWATTRRPALLAQRIPALTGGLVRAPALSLYGVVAPRADTLAVQVSLELSSEKDAQVVVPFLRAQMAQLDILAQSRGWLAILSKSVVMAEGQTVRATLEMNPAELTRLYANLFAGEGKH